MDNTVLPYTVHTDTSEESDSSDSSEEGNLLSNNLGVFNNKFETKDVRFMNQEKAEDYQLKRNQLFTPPIQKRYFTVSFSDSKCPKRSDGSDLNPLSLRNDIKLPTDNIIGFKMIKSNFDGNLKNFVDLTIPEIPEIACDKNENGETIFARIPLRKHPEDAGAAADYYTHQFLELSLIDRYFYPSSFDNLTISLKEQMSGFIVIEVTYLNQ